MSLYLEVKTAVGNPGRIDISDSEDFTETGAYVLSLLNEGHPWVRLRSENQENWLSEWTVLERRSDGTPSKIGFREFDGALQVIRNTHGNCSPW